MNTYLKILFVFAASSLITACVPSSATTATPAPTEVSTDAPLSQKTGMPTVSLVIPTGLATNTLTGVVPAFTPQSDNEWPVPEYVHVLLECEPYKYCTIHSAEIQVYAAADLAAKDPRAAGDIRAVQKVLAKPDASYSKKDLPGPPPPYAPLGIALSVKEKVIPFKNGRGVRYLLELKSDVSPIVNDLTYFFSGLTDDGKYYITGKFGTSLPTLQDDVGSNTAPPGGVPFPTDLNGQAYDDYMKKITELIDGSAPDRFSPTLDSLDELIQSISIK
jgi:hypothetical protein